MRYWNHWRVLEPRLNQGEVDCSSQRFSSFFSMVQVWRYFYEPRARELSYKYMGQKNGVSKRPPAKLHFTQTSNQSPKLFAFKVKLSLEFLHDIFKHVGLIKMRDVGHVLETERFPRTLTFILSSTTESHPLIVHREKLVYQWHFNDRWSNKTWRNHRIRSFLSPGRKFMVQYKADNPDDDSIHDGRQIAESKSTLLEEFKLTKSTFPISPTKLTFKMMFNRIFEEKRVQQEAEMKKQAEKGRTLAVTRRNQKAKKQDAEKTFLKKCKTFVSKVWH